MTDDAELLRRYANDHDESAFGELVERHLPLVYSAAQRRLGGDTHAATDVAQQVFIELARGQLSAVQRRLLPGWLYTTTRHVAIDFIRGERRRRVREQEAHAMNENTGGSAPSQWENIRPVLDEVMDELGRDDRRAVLLRFFAQQSFPQIGSLLGVTQDAARMRVERALDKMRIRLARRGVQSTGAALGLILASEAASAAPEGAVKAITTAALQATTIGTAPGSGLIHFMSTSKTVISGAGIALVFGLVTTFYQSRSLRNAEKAAEALSRSMSALRAQADLSQHQADEAERNLASEQAIGKIVAATAMSVAGANRPGNVGDSAMLNANPLATGRAFLKDHPEMTGLIAGYATAVTTSRYYELMRRLNLTPSQMKQFVELAAQLQAGVRWDSTTQSPYAEVNVGDLSRVQIESQLHVLLGDDGYSQYQDFTRVIQSHARSVTEQVITSQLFTATPITTDQANQLTELVTQNSSHFQGGGGLSLMPAEWDKVIESAAGMLSATQLASLVAIRDKAQFQQALNQAVTQAVAEAKIAAEIPMGP